MSGLIHGRQRNDKKTEKSIRRWNGRTDWERFLVKLNWRLGLAIDEWNKEKKEFWILCVRCSVCVHSLFRSKRWKYGREMSQCNTLQRRCTRPVCRSNAFYHRWRLPTFADAEANAQCNLMTSRRLGRTANAHKEKNNPNESQKKKRNKIKRESSPSEIRNL